DVALSRAGDLAVIGVPYDDVGGFRVGAAYVYVRTEGGPSGGWELEAALVPSEADVESYLGQRVAIGGEPGAEVVALGGYLEGDDPDDRRSAAHVFRRDPSTGAWADEGPLWAEGATEDGHFGGSIAAVGDLVLVGAARGGRDLRRGAPLPPHRGGGGRSRVGGGAPVRQPRRPLREPAGGGGRVRWRGRGALGGRGARRRGGPRRRRQSGAGADVRAAWRG